MNGSTRNGPGPLETPVVLGRIEQAADPGGAVDEEPAQLPARPAPLALEQAIHEARHEVDVVKAVGDEHLKRLRYDEHVGARHRLEHPAIDAAVEVEHLLVERFPGVVLLVDRVGRLLGSLRERGAAVHVEQREGARAVALVEQPQQRGGAFDLRRGLLGLLGHDHLGLGVDGHGLGKPGNGRDGLDRRHRAGGQAGRQRPVGSGQTREGAATAENDSQRGRQHPDRANATETVAASHVSDPPRSQKIDAQGASPDQYSGTCRGGRWKLRLGGLHRARALCRAHSRAMVVGSTATDRRAD